VVDEVGVLEVARVERHRGWVKKNVTIVLGFELEKVENILSILRAQRKGLISFILQQLSLF
jgi:hypothetical protein